MEYKIPFRSNLKLFENKIILSDQINSLYVLDSLNGEKIRIIPTEDTTLKNNFINSIATDNKNNLKKLFFWIFYTS